MMHLVIQRRMYDMCQGTCTIHTIRHDMAWYRKFPWFDLHFSPILAMYRVDIVKVAYLCLSLAATGPLSTAAAWRLARALVGHW